jgi:hypothetical protein
MLYLLILDFSFRFHDFDALAAAKRLAKYWKTRQEIFQDRAHLPFLDLSSGKTNNRSSSGALTSDDIVTLKTGVSRHLPHDRHGRTVFFCDGSKKRPDVIPSLRHVFFIGQIVMENAASRSNGFAVIYNVSNPYAVSFNKKVIRELISFFFITLFVCLTIYTNSLLFLPYVPMLT